MKIIERPQYMNRLIQLRGTPDIKIITGIRRSGKSKLMNAYMDYVRSSEEKSNIIFVDFVNLAFESLKDYHVLYQYIENHYRDDAVNYVFIDEVQLCPHFELVINSLHAKEQFDIYITGSNAFLLSADLATLFTGRYIEIHIFPFSFREYKEYYSEQKNMDRLFDSYVLSGGLSGSYVYRTEQDKYQYIKEVYETIVNRDLVQKYNLPDTVVLNMLSEYLMDNVSNLTSPNKVSNTLVSNKVSTNHVTVGRYIKYLCNAFLFYNIKRFDIKGKKYLETSDKYFLCDTGIRYAVLGSRNMDYGRLYENIVCLELLRRNYEVYIGKLYEKEIDFVAKRGSEQIYVQVSDDIGSPDTFQRECGSLLKIKDAYPKYVIARTRHETYTYEGIIICDIAEWLLK